MYSCVYIGFKDEMKGMCARFHSKNFLLFTRSVLTEMYREEAFYINTQTRRRK